MEYDYRNRDSASYLLNASSMEMLAKEIDGARTEIARLEQRTLEVGITMWEMEQMMRQDFLNAYQKGNVDEIDGIEHRHDGTSVKVSILNNYTAMAHETWNEELQEYDIHPYYDLSDMLDRTKEWVIERIHKQDWKIAQCDAGQRRRFISNSVFGLDCALMQIGWTIRYETRLQQAEYLNCHGVFAEITDRIEAYMREVIASLFSFASPPNKGSDKPKSRPAEWSNANWNRVFNAYLVEREVDSFKDWMSVLPKWDRKPRLDNWLIDASLIPVKDTDPEVVKWISRTILQVAVMRTYKPSEKHDTIPVIVGPQGCGKSTAISHLLPEKNRRRWFCDSLVLSDTEKKRVESLQGAVMVEISEMTGATTHEIESIKAFLSRTDDRVRLSYRKNPENTPRLVSMVGTANGTAVLPNDPTGNRRFIAINLASGDPFKVRQYLQENRLQLWAEAKYRIQEQGETCYFPRELAEAQSNANEAVRSSDDVLEDSLLEYLVECHKKGNQHLILNDIIYDLKLTGGDAPETISFQDKKRLTRVLERYGMKKTRTRVGNEGVRKRCWTFPINFMDVINNFAPPVYES